jgi:hypothetical protein
MNGMSEEAANDTLAGIFLSQASVVSALVEVLKRKGVIDLEDCREIHDLSLTKVETIPLSNTRAISVARRVLEGHWAELLGVGQST